MGIYVNPGNSEFAGWVQDELFVDKSGLIQHTNRALGTSNCRILVSRPRRFGKTAAMSMLEAYYSCGCDSRDLFRGLAIEKDPSFEEHLNKYTVIAMDMQGLYLRAKSENQLDRFACYVSEVINEELAELYPDEVRGNEHALWDSLPAIYDAHKARFVFLIDEWDVIYREEKDNEALKEDFTDLMILLFKNGNISGCIELAYLTGILPIPPQRSQSGLNNFWQYTALTPSQLRPYFGFTEAEVEGLCRKAQMPLQDLKAWYDGYSFDKEDTLYCPFSVTQALDHRSVDSYWGKTGSDAQLLLLLDAEDPLYQAAARDLLSGQQVSFSADNRVDFSTLGYLSELLSALVHLGYLSCLDDRARIPNQEVAADVLSTLRQAKHNPAYGILHRCKYLLAVLADGDAGKVAQYLQENYNLYTAAFSAIRARVKDRTDARRMDKPEDDLACIIIASYGGWGEDHYAYHREFSDGKGFADIVFLPRQYGSDKMPIIVEMKWDESADAAIRQIREGRYAGLAHGYPRALLVEVCCKKGKDAKFRCTIEEVENP